MFSCLFPPIASGSSHMCFRLSRELVRAGHQVTVFCAGFDGAPLREEMFGIRVIRLPAWRLPRLALTYNFKWFGMTLTPANLAIVRDEFRKERFDVLHAHNHIFDLSLAAVWAARHFKVPLALTLHTIAQHPHRLWNGVLAGLDVCLARWLVLRQADAVVSPDPQMSKYIARRFGITNPPLIPYGLDLPIIRPEDGLRVRLRHGLGRGPVILSLGHVHALRDRHDLIHAMPVILGRHPDACLLIVGDVSIEAPRRWVAELGLNDKVVFSGAVPQEEVPAYLAAADVEAHWLNGLNALSLAGMEAMAAGVATVTTSYAEEEADGLRPGDNVLTVPVNNPEATGAALADLLDDHDLRRRIARKGKEYVIERYSWPGVCRQTEELYGRLIGRRTLPQLARRFATSAA
jgi:glycosyltransferase involved in cell wall biosynthesis